MRSLLILLVLVALTATGSDAAREIEPNNHWLQATLIDGSEPVEGALNDEQDVYKLLLPETGEVTVVLDQYPPGANLTLEVLGFRKDPIVPINRVKSRGTQQLKAVFNAQERIGYLAVTVTPAEKVCRDQWCIMRLVSDGPYYLLQSGPTLPPSYNEQPIVAPPDYRLSIVHPEILRRQRQEAKTRQAFSGLPLFRHDDSQLQFRYPPDWAVRTTAPDRIEVGPRQAAGAEIQVAINLRDKADFPGSSAGLQLNLAEKNLLDANGHIAKRGEMTLLERTAPYLLGGYTDPGKGAEMALLQLVLDHGDHYVWISYTAPAARYAEFTPGLATILKTLALPPADPGA